MTAKREEPVTPNRATRGRDILFVPVDIIEIGQRLRPLDASWAIALGHTMLGEGQQTPIVLSRVPGRDTFKLVSGAHRLAAARTYSGLAPVKAVFVDGDGAENRLRKMAAQLNRGDIPPIERAALLADMRDLCDIGEAEFHDQRLSGDRSLLLHTDRIADLTGLSLSDVERSLALHRRLAARIAEMMRGSIASRSDAQMHELSRFDWLVQEKIAYLLLGGMRSVAEAKAELANKVKAPPMNRQVGYFIAAFERMSMDEKRRALSELARLLPRGIAITGLD